MSDVKYEISADASAVVQEIGKVRKSLNSMRKLDWAVIATGVQSVMQNFSTVKNIVEDVFQAVVKPAAEVESYLLTFETMLGSAEEAAAYMNKLRDYASSTPFELSDITSAATVLLGFSVSAEKSCDVMAQLGDIAAVTGTSLKELAMIYGKVSAIGLDTETVNQLAERSVDVRAVLAQRDGLSVAEVQKRIAGKQYGQKDLDFVLSALTAEGGKFYGATERQANSLKGLFSTMRDGVNDVAVAIGNKLLPLIKEVTQRAMQALPVIKQWVESWGVVAEVGTLMSAHIEEPAVFVRQRERLNPARFDEVVEVDAAMVDKLTKQLYEQRQARAAARGSATFAKLSAGEQARQVQAALSSLGFTGSIQSPSEVEKFLNDVQQDAAQAGDKKLFERAAYQRRRYATLQTTSHSVLAARRGAHTALARQHIVEGGDPLQLARFDATQSAFAMAQQYMAAGMGQQEATHLAATQVARDMQTAAMPAQQAATIAQSRVAVGGGGTSLRIGDAQLDVARRHLNISEEIKRVMDNISAMLQQRNSPSIPVVL